MNVFDNKMNNFLNDMEKEIRSSTNKKIIDVIDCCPIGKFSPVNLKLENNEFILTCEHSYMFDGAVRYKDIFFKRCDLTLGDWYNIYACAIKKLDKLNRR